MSEQEIKKLEEYKNFLLKQYTELGGRSNSAQEWDLSTLMLQVESQKKINELNAKLEEKKTPEKPSTFSPSQYSVDKSRENATLAKEAALITGAYMNWAEPQFDTRSIFDERYKRDNELIKFESEAEKGSTVILRDLYGRLA